MSDFALIFLCSRGESKREQLPFEQFLQQIEALFSHLFRTEKSAGDFNLL